jgi:hypothetical protein
MLCGIRSPIEPSKVYLTGSLNESDELEVKIAFGPISSAGGGPACDRGVITSNFGTLAPLTTRVAATRTVTTRLAHVVTTATGKFIGTATVIVIPVEGNQ